MLKLQEKQKLMVFRNETKGGSIFYTASFDSVIKVDNKEKRNRKSGCNTG